MTPAPVVEADVGVVGAGPGGMAAALRIAASGLSVVVLDEGMRPGGQIFRQLPDGFVQQAPTDEPPSHDAGHGLLHELGGSKVQVVPRAVVWDAQPPGEQPGGLWFEQDGRSRLLRCRAIVLATGAYDRCVPFPGWTLPGVITAGAAQVMVRGFGVRPGARAVVAGSGPLLLPTVTALASAGVEILAALEAAPRLAALKALPGVLRSGARLKEALYYARKLWQTGVRLRFSHTIFAVEGDGRVERATIGRVDAAGRPLRHTARTVECDVVCAGFGLIPSIELGQRLGCAASWHEARGGWRIEANAFGATSVPSVFAVGEIAGVGGGEVAIQEGEAAAAGVCAALQGSRPDPALDRKAKAKRAAADAMLRAFPPLPGLVELAQPDTVVCRCEDVTAQQIQAAARLHGGTVRAVKMGCRAGMGPCQGRICAPNVQALAGLGRAAPPDLPKVQVPIKPVRTATILDAPRL